MNSRIERSNAQDAVDRFARVARERPGDAVAQTDLAIALSQAGRVDEAVDCFRQAAALAPNSAAVQCNLGTALTEQGRLDEALAVQARAAQLNPGLPQLHISRGHTLRMAGQFDAAAQSFQRAIESDPGNADARFGLANLLKESGRASDAVTTLREAIALRPDDHKVHSCLLLTMNYDPACPAESILEEARRWAERHAARASAALERHTNAADPDRRLKVGYVSADFKAHPSDAFLRPLLATHDADRYQVYCYSEVLRGDETTAEFQRQAFAWRNTVRLSDRQFAEQVRADEIDVLVDLKLHTAGNRLLVFARRPAPVQLTWLGYPGTTGLDCFDARLTDPYLDPPGAGGGPGPHDAFYSEPSWRLPHTFWCYQPPAEADLPVGPAPLASNGYVTFASLNNFAKTNDDVLRLWAEVLAQVPGSRLLLLAPAGSARQRVLAIFTERGVDAQRVEFVGRLPRAEYFANFRRADIALDPFPYNGHTTSLDSLWMGVPVVTLVGPTAAGRAGLGQLSNLGLTELITYDPAQYVAIARALAYNAARLGELRATLRQRMAESPLMDARGFTRAIEDAYRHLWTDWCRRAVSAGNS